MATMTEKLLSRLSTTYVITLYIGGNPFLSGGGDYSPDAKFIYALEEELARRGVRSLDNSIGWDVSPMSDDVLTQMDDYLEGIWNDIRDGMRKTIAEGWAKKHQAQQSA